VRTPPDVALNVPEETLRGYPGMVIREADGERVLESMVWGFPRRLKGMKPDSKPGPVNNIADLSKPMWIGLAEKPQGRCVIPPAGFAEPAGPRGAKTRSVREQAFNIHAAPFFALVLSNPLTA
jgi:putative SOS response-associated peptidase YedK